MRITELVFELLIYKFFLCSKVKSGAELVNYKCKSFLKMAANLLEWSKWRLLLRSFVSIYKDKLAFNPSALARRSRLKSAISSNFCLYINPRVRTFFNNWGESTFLSVHFGSNFNSVDKIRIKSLGQYFPQCRLLVRTYESVVTSTGEYHIFREHVKNSKQSYCICRRKSLTFWLLLVFMNVVFVCLFSRSVLFCLLPAVNKT